MISSPSADRRSLPAIQWDSGCFTIRFVRLLDYGGFRRSAMKPEPVTAGKRFVGGKRLRSDSRPAHGEQAIMPRHPRDRKIRMFGMDENRGATQARSIPIQVAGEIGPREFGQKQIFARATGGYGDDGLRARPKSKRQTAITFPFGAPKCDGLARRRPRELEIDGTTFRSGR